MKDTTLIKDKDLAYEVYLVSKKYCVVTDILCIDYANYHLSQLAVLFFRKHI